MKKLIVANWKMNKTQKDVEDFCVDFKQKFTNQREAWLSTQAHLLPVAIQHATSFLIGSQNVSEFDDGAYTGELSASSLKDLGVKFTLIGHSERRQYFKETSSDHQLKIKKALSAGLKVIYCIGETLQERQLQLTDSILWDQLHKGLRDIRTTSDDLIIAYEPVWAIGTGLSADPSMANQAHEFIRKSLTQLGFEGEKIRILYGGSVKTNNIDAYLKESHIDGALVGGASLKAQDFLALCNDR